MKIKGAIFDMDGTLVDSLMYWESFWQSLNDEYMKQENFTPDAELDKAVRAMIFEDAIMSIKDRYNISASAEELLDFSERGLEKFYIHTAKVKNGAIELLEYLKSKGIKICLASATERRFVDIAIKGHGIDKYFDYVVSCCDIGVGKDRPDVYLLAKDKLGCEADEICVFEDSYVAIETAKGAGFRTAGVYDKYNYRHDRLRASSDIYMDKGHTLDEFIDIIE